MPGVTSKPTAIVLVDYQNVYRGARNAFGWNSEPGHYGNIKPIALARTLAPANKFELIQARVYTGVPTPKRDHKGNAIMQRRIAAWVADSPELVEVFPRPLSYPPDRGREKGVDVELAIDLVALALDDAFDTAIVASADTDLVPALQLVHNRCGKAIQTVAWEALPGYEADTAAPIDIPGGGVERRTLKKHTFDRLCDRRNFTMSNDDPSSTVGKDRWDRITKRL